MGRRKKTPIKVKSDVIDEVILRIDECQRVLEELENSATWKILIKDIQLQKQQIDDNWQDMTEEKLEKARILKFAAKHILNLKDSYLEELKQRQEELKVYQNPQENIIKDYDTDSKME